MKNNLISLPFANLPPGLVGNQIPFDMALIAQQSAAPTAPSFSRAQSSPDNWSPIAGDSDDVDVGASSSSSSRGEGGGDDEQCSASAGLLAAPAPPAYSTPRETSAAYRSGLLKSDSNISSNHRRIRLAIRYNLLKEEEDGTGGGHSTRGGPTTDDDDDDEDLFLCWINEAGIPHHFRRMRPVVCHVSPEAGKTEDGIHAPNGGGGTGQEYLTGGGGPNHSSRRTAAAYQYRNATTLLVNENDRIETTYPGHAFVFCKRVECRRNIDTTSVEVGRNDGNNDPMVVHDDNMTFFLRRAKKKSDNKADENVDLWEKYLVVGGYRPGPMPGTTEDGDGNLGRDDDSEAESDGDVRSSHDDDEKEENPMPETLEDEDGDIGADDSEVKSDGGERSSHDGAIEEIDEGSDHKSDDDSHDEEHLLQLVTIQYVRKNPNASANENKIDVAKRDMNCLDCNPPSKVIRCSTDCIQGTVPFLGGMMNANTRNTPAFVATTDDCASLKHDGIAFFEDGTLSISATVSRLDPTPLDTSAKHYDEVILGGWPCRVEPGSFPADMSLPGNGRNLLRMRFELDLMAASICLPPEARAKLKKCTPIWINKSQSYGPKAAPVRARDACFHPGAGWLKRNGMRPDKCGGVEFFDARHYLSDCDLWGPGGLMLHELSHAWHSKFVEGGYDNEEITEIYNMAMEDGLYDCVRVRGPQGPSAKAYACQDQMEYFAELSVAFLGGQGEEEHNKWYPFNRSQLRDHDPRAFAMLCRVWGLEDNELRRGVELSGHEDGKEASN